MSWLINVLIIVISIFQIAKKCSSEHSVHIPSKSSLIDITSNQEDADGVHSNIVDIHLAMKYGSTSANLKDLIRDEVNTQLSDSKVEKTESQNNILEAKTPIVARSTTDNQVDDNLSIKLDNVAHNIQETLKFIQTNSKDGSCSSETSPLGVRCNSCFRTIKNDTRYPANCKEIQKNGNNVSGIYLIQPTYAEIPFYVLCDMTTMGGGWTHIQKRFDGSQDFFLGWRDYKFGFGDLEGEFWLGLQKIHLLTGFDSTELLVEIVDRDNVSAHAHFKTFGVGPEKEGYKLDRLSGFSGEAGDSLTYHLGQKFSTKDLDFTNSCATQFLGGWWYKTCHISNLNGKFINVDIPAKYVHQGLHWKTFRSHEYCHSKSRMLVRPA